MSCRIEDYAIVGNCETVALVGRDGSVDWLGLPRFDSAACFAALLGDSRHGRWLIAPADAVSSVTRTYSGDTLILETVFRTGAGAVRLTDFMTRGDRAADLVRIVTGLEGTVAMRMELIVRFDYGSVVPWVSRQEDGRLQFIAGPDRLLLETTASVHGEDRRSVAEFTVGAGETTNFRLSWSPSWSEPPQPAPVAETLHEVEAEWSGWATTFDASFEGSGAVMRSLLTLKSLTHFETGGIVAAGTTSLPERIGGERNWDYRYCWLRDSTFTLLALIGAGYLDEAKAWHQWLLRAVAGSPDDVQTMYGVAGERRLNEFVVSWLPGYEGAAPVRIGNAAVKQLQLDVYGEVLDTFYVGRRAGLATSEDTWALESGLVDHLETIWREPDEGIWEVRGPRRHFTHSKVMAWVAFDCAVRSIEEFGLEGPVDRWRGVRDEIHADVCERGFDPAQNAFVQSYGSTALDAAVLLIPQVGFLPPDDSRVHGTVAAIERKLMRNGFVLRYDTESDTDGLPPGEGAFLACSFWLADAYALTGRLAEARALFDRLLALRNDVGLLAEEYDPVEKRQLGNFPQAFSHLALINTAHNLANAAEPAKTRANRSTKPVGPISPQVAPARNQPNRPSSGGGTATSPRSEA